VTLIPRIGDLELKSTTYDVDAGVATISFHRPEAMNAWTGRMHHEYRACLEAANDDPDVGAIVVTGTGRAFCAGGDRRGLVNHIERGKFDAGVDVAALPMPGYGVSAEYDHLYAYHLGILKPIVGAVNGAVAGIGLVIACFCDVRFAANGAKFTVAASKLGLTAEYGLSWLLPRIVGLGHAADLLMTSRVFLAEEAERIGLVNRTMPPGDLMPFVADYARQLAQSSPSSLREIKRQLYADLHRGVGAAVHDAERTLERLVTEPDYQEGVAAWLDRRPPQFRRKAE
jgi:enoyl-CoA hydratase/carnithine racemase